MLQQASVDALRHGDVSRKRGYIAVTMHHYPRGLKKDLRDEYISALAPGDTLLHDFLAHVKKLGEDHNAAFEACHYEKRFGITAEGLGHLQRLIELSTSKDVYLVCQCRDDERCHRELLLMLAREWYGAKTAPLRFDYETFARRLQKKPPANLDYSPVRGARGRGLEWPIPLRD